MNAGTCRNASVAVALSSLFLFTPAGAQTQEDAAATLDELLQAVRNQGSELAEQNRQREQDFRARRDDQLQMLRDAQAEVRAAEARSADLKSRFDANELELEKLNETLRIRIGDMGELFGVVRQVAGDTKGVVDTSLVSAQLGERGDTVNRLAQANGLPSIEDLRSLQALLLEEMIESGKIVRFTRAVEDAAGFSADAEIIRVGVFNLIGDHGYLTFDPATQSVRELPRQPAGHFVSAATRYFDSTSGHSEVPVDPSRGTLLSLVIQTPDFLEQVSNGGAVGYTILVIGLVGLAIALYRLFALQAVGGRIRKQLRTESASTGNPLGRVLAVYEANRRLRVDVLELKLDEAIMRETPRLERFQGTIKVFAGIAPLMGLLGTVVGMIRTFQSITLFGTGDPKLMADGISQALVTTVEGLVVAIPLVFMHAIISGRSRNLIEVLEEQSAGMVARRAEETA